VGAGVGARRPRRRRAAGRRRCGELLGVRAAEGASESAPAGATRRPRQRAPLRGPRQRAPLSARPAGREWAMRERIQGLGVRSRARFVAERASFATPGRAIGRTGSDCIRFPAPTRPSSRTPSSFSRFPGEIPGSSPPAHQRVARHTRRVTNHARKGHASLLASLPHCPFATTQPRGERRPLARTPQQSPLARTPGNPQSAADAGAPRRSAPRRAP
jgi:hypothetical protein